MIHCFPCCPVAFAHEGTRVLRPRKPRFLSSAAHGAMALFLRLMIRPVRVMFYDVAPQT